MSPSSLRRKLLWLIAGRALAITLVLGSAILVQYRVEYNPALAWFQIGPFFALIGLTYALTFLWIWTLRFVDRHKWLIDVQVACDALIVSAIVYLTRTDGVTSYFSSLYALPIVAASTVQSWRGGLTVSLLSCAMYTGMVLAQYLTPPGTMPFIVQQVLPATRVAIFTVGLNVFGFMAVAGLSGYLAEGLRRTGAQLEEASTQLADLQAFNQHVIDSLRSGLATSDMEGRLLTFNRAAETITGMPAVEVVGRPVVDVLQLPAALVLPLTTGDARAAGQRHEFGYRRTDGRRIEIGMTSAPLLTPRGESGFLFTFQDVTELMKHDREARIQQRLAAVGEMAAGIAHEIRNPLASMAGSIQILRDELPLTPDQSQLMDIVLRESDRLNDTIKNFLSFARPQRSAMTDLDLRTILRDTARLLRNNAEVTEQHAIVVDEPREPVIYRADEAQIKQIVWNLATNGLRAMAGGGELRLAVHAVPTEVVIGVSDEGVGIAPEDMDGIFQPFRGGFARGTGLGLSIVHRIASDYGGEVRVTSERGKGTTVQVALPIAAAAPPLTLADDRKGVV
jgi:two-component system sensor histidine kinase PilS (NtrC family)